MLVGAERECASVGYVADQMFLGAMEMVERDTKGKCIYKRIGCVFGTNFGLHTRPRRI